MKLKITSILFFLNFSLLSLFAGTATWIGPTSGDWETAANWSTASTPLSTDSVSIPLSFTVTLSSDAGTINKIAVSGKLIIAATGSLNVEQTVNAVGSSPIVNLVGGDIENNGVLTIKNSLSTSSNTCIKFSQSSRNNNLINNGLFTLDNTSGAYASITGRAIGLSQATGTGVSTFKMGGTVNLNIKAGCVFIESNEGGNLTLDGTNVIGSTSNFKNFRFARIIVGANVGGKITIAPTADITLYSGFDSASNGIINLNGNSTSSACTFTNNGKFTIHSGASTAGYGIFFNPGNSNVLNYLTNSGTMVVEGTFLNGNAVYIAGTASGVSNFNNTSTGVLTLSIPNPAVQVIKTAATNNKLTLVNDGVMNISQTADISVTSTVAVITNNGTINKNVATIIAKNVEFKGKISINGQAIIVTLPTNENIQMTLTDLAGRTIKSAKLHGVSNVVDVNNLKGIYIISLRTKDNNYTQKLSL